MVFISIGNQLKKYIKNSRKSYAVPSITLASFVTSLAFLARKRPLSSVS